MEDKTLALLKQSLKSKGFSLTNVRRTIFGLLWQSQPQAMNELMSRGRGQFDRASLYRTIKLFESIGIVQRVNIGWKYKLELSDSYLAHHHHLICLSCGRLIELKSDKKIERLIDELVELHNFTPTGHQLEIQGYCVSCHAG
jgi:Fur family ferric uptake transcriptional regulator